MKAEVQRENVPLRVWLDLNKEMHASGHNNVTAQKCKDKFSVMYAFFSESLLKTGGFVGGVKWQHYNSFCVIFDLPEDYRLEEEGCAVAQDDDEHTQSYENKGKTDDFFDTFWQYTCNLWIPNEIVFLACAFKFRAQC